MNSEARFQGELTPKKTGTGRTACFREPVLFFKKKTKLVNSEGEIIEPALVMNGLVMMAIRLLKAPLTVLPLWLAHRVSRGHLEALPTSLVYRQY